MKNKLEILLSYTHAQIRDTWVALGSLIANKSFTAGNLYKTSEGDLIFCQDDFFGTIDFTSFSVSDNDLISEEKVISPNFKFILSNADFLAIVNPIDVNWIPFQLDNTSNLIQISDHDFEQILLEVGVPFIQLQELEFTREKIIDLMIRPALEEYFKWFPKIRVETFPAKNVYSEFKIEMPSWAYGVKRAFITQGTASSAISNPLLRFYDEAMWSYSTGNTGILGRGGHSKQPGFSNLRGFDAMTLDRAARQGMVNYAQKIHFRVSRENGKRYFSGHVNKVGVIEVHYTEWTNNWDDVDFNRLNEARDLATAKVLRALGMLRSQVKSDIPGSLDYSGFLSRADLLESRVIETWQSITRTSIYR